VNAAEHLKHIRKDPVGWKRLELRERIPITRECAFADMFYRTSHIGLSVQTRTLPGHVAKVVEIDGAGPEAWWLGSDGEVKVGR
jgi:hypothetical protein